MRSRLDEVNDIFFNLPNPSSCIRPGVYAASNTNEYNSHKNNVSGE
jgi:hypothetical protein